MLLVVIQGTVITADEFLQREFFRVVEAHG
jgi:hypothetical protein